ncbi:MAG: D-glycerate dehydrogenase [Betaproteobacteria bacterium]|nr:D-glycerate dehydrogenase [Betaproteobacteria bacterium]MDH3437472.1 D-glycerate dehydrogenase [Betaproteobacteria bacterium]
MKPKILITREVFDETLEYVGQYCEVEANQEDVAFDPERLARRLSDKDGVMCCLPDRIDATLLAGSPQLKVVANIAVGYNNIDLAACTARRIMATNTPGVLDDSTADLAWTLMLGAARRVTELERRVRNGEWTGWRLKQWMGVDVHHATLGIFGMGRIGQAIAKRASGFDMKVIYHNRTRVASDLEKRLNANYVTKDELLRQSDFVVLQVPYAPETHHMIGAAELKQMKPGAILINSTRGGVVDDVALIAALKGGMIRAAGLDVFENEPRLNPEFLELDNVVLTPHVGSSTEATRRAMAMTAARNLVAALSGAAPPNLLNPEAR